MRTSPERSDDARGRHTTTERQLLKLRSGALLIDTPGMRELALWADSDTELAGGKGPDVLTPEQRAAELLKPRPRNLPIAPAAPPARRNLALAEYHGPGGAGGTGAAGPVYGAPAVGGNADSGENGGAGAGGAGAGGEESGGAGGYGDFAIYGGPPGGAGN